VVLEAISMARKDTNSHGVAFISALIATSPGPLDPIEPLTRKSLDGLRAAVKAAGSAPDDVLRVTCFLSSLDQWSASRKLIEAEYPRAALNLVQTLRAPAQAMAACEAVARLAKAPAGPLEIIAADGLPRDEGQSAMALLGAQRAVFTGTQVAFGFQESDAQLAFGRLTKAIEQVGGSPAQVAWTSYYALSGRIAAQVRKVRAGHFGSGKPPAGSLLLFEALPSMDAGFAVDAIAVKE
jgi:enamine deaminase RidA (YjgF/YER057c/UK114 family)